MGKQSKIAYNVYNVLKQKYEIGEYISPWIAQIHDTPNNIGLNCIWLYQNPVNMIWFKNTIKIKIGDMIYARLAWGGGNIE